MSAWIKPLHASRKSIFVTNHVKAGFESSKKETEDHLNKIKKIRILSCIRLDVIDCFVADDDLSSKRECSPLTSQIEHKINSSTSNYIVSQGYELSIYGRSKPDKSHFVVRHFAWNSYLVMSLLFQSKQFTLFNI